MTPAEARPLDVSATYIHLTDDAAVHPVPVDDRFWAELTTRPELAALASGRLLCVLPYAHNWTSWERHPEGVEVVRIGHTARVVTPGAALHITRGAGSEHPPL